MNTLNYRGLPRAPGWLRATLVLLLLGGCGGGVDSGGTGGAAVYASGPINGFGSIIVNGVRFDDSSSALDVRDDDGGLRSKSELKLGMVVEVRGSTITTDVSGVRSSTASSITLGSEIVGPIGAGFNPAATTFVVLGRNIDVQPTTVFADVGGMGGLAQGQVVEVYGLYNAFTDRFTATRIERKFGAVSTYRIRGPITIPVPGTPRFLIGSELIDYSTLVGGNLPANLTNGTVVRVRFSASQTTAGVWNATQLRDGTSRPDDGQHSKLEGLIDGYTATGFSIAGIPVTTQGVIPIPAGSVLNNGVRVEVEGTFINGALAASSIEVEDDFGNPEFEFHGPVEAVTPTTLAIHGVNISYD
ncbi:MAG: DUF5666 domain-containing protein, partial [Burkholderiaceae bacterium]